MRASNVFSKPVLSNSFSNKAVELLAQQVKQKVFDITLFTQEVNQTFYSKKDLAIVSKFNFGAMTFNNGNSPPILMICTSKTVGNLFFDKDVVKKCYDIVKEQFLKLGEKIGEIQDYCFYSKNGTITIIATLASCENTGNVIVFNA